MDPIGDLLVFAPDTPEVMMMVEVKAALRDRAALEARLRRSMSARLCPVALLVTREKSWMYRDNTSSDADDPIEVVGEFDTASLLDVEVVPTSERQLERDVFDWLARLAASWIAALPTSDDVKQAVYEHVVPVISEGRVVYGHAA